MQRLWDFVNEYAWAATKLTRRKKPRWVREDLEWWNDLLPAYNEVLFFDTCSRHTISLYTDACLYGLGEFFFEGRGDWPTAAIDQINAFLAIVNGKILSPNRRMAKNPDDPIWSALGAKNPPGNKRMYRRTLLPCWSRSSSSMCLVFLVFFPWRIQSNMRIVFPF